MKILKVYAVGFTTIIKRFRLISLAYLSLLIPALIVALPFHSYFIKATSQYISPGKLLAGFDYTAYSELINFRGDEIKAAFSQSFWLLIFYFFISVFVSGAILHILQDREKKAKFLNFITGGSKYFWRFLRLSIIFFILHALVAIIIYVAFGIMVKNAFEHAATEKSTFFLFLPFLVVHLLIAIYLLIISNYSRFIIVQTGSRLVLKSIWKALKFISSKFFGTYGLILLLFIFPLLFLMIYLKASTHVEMTSGLMIFFAFLIQQFYIWLKEAFRIWTYSSQFDYYMMYNNDIKEADIQPEIKTSEIRDLGSGDKNKQPENGNNDQFTES
jgi:hypothetical protein